MSAFKDKKKGTWYYKFQLDGKQYLKRGFSSKSEAIARELELRESIISGNAEDREQRINDIIDSYLKKVSMELKESSYIKDEIIFKSHIKPYLGALKAFELSNRKIIEWKRMILDKGVSIARANQIIAKMKLLVEFGIINNKMDSKLLADLKPISIQEKREEMLFWTVDEFKRFSSAIDILDWKVFFDNLFYTGCRIGELLALTPEDIIGNEYNIDKQLTEEFNITSPKTKLGYRSILMPEWIVKETKEFIKRNKVSANKPIFDEGYSRTHVRRVKDRYCQKSGVKKIRIHDFRHSCCSMLIQTYLDHNMTIDFLFIANRMGHTVQETQNTYAHLYPKTNQSIISFL